MKNLGKVAIVTLAIVIFIILTAVFLTFPQKLHAATYAAQTIVVKPFNGESNLTVVFRDQKTGNVFNATDGTSVSTTSWANGEFAATQHSYSGDWIVTLPATSFRTLYFTYYDAAVGNVTAATPPTGTPALYDVSAGQSFSDASPTENGRVKVRTN